jgi:hypothetical protein
MLSANGISAWSILAVPLFCMPAYLPVTASSVNYAPVVFVGFVVIAFAWYAAWGRKNYRGPPTESLGEDPTQGDHAAGGPKKD